MKLHVVKTGEGPALLILHGLFGLSDNWMTVSKSFVAAGFTVFAVDLRNHGRSPHSDEMSYPLMAADILELLNLNQIPKANIIGHSMGGKTAMFFAVDHPERIQKLIVVDIAPRYYPPHHQAILAALHSFEPSNLSSRKEAETFLRAGIGDEPTIQFLLKNLYWNDENKLAWRFNISGIEDHILKSDTAMPEHQPISVPTLFIRGEKSGYITKDDEADIKRRFSNVSFTTIQDAGHWVHAEQPAAFLKVALAFLQNS